MQIGLVTNLATLTLFDLALGQKRKLINTIMYLVSVSIVLRSFFDLKQISMFAMIANSLSVSLGPLGVLA